MNQKNIFLKEKLQGAIKIKAVSKLCFKKQTEHLIK